MALLAPMLGQFLQGRECSVVGVDIGKDIIKRARTYPIIPSDKVSLRFEVMSGVHAPSVHKAYTFHLAPTLPPPFLHLASTLPHWRLSGNDLESFHE